MPADWLQTMFPKHLCHKFANSAFKQPGAPTLAFMSGWGGSRPRRLLEPYTKSTKTNCNSVQKPLLGGRVGHQRTKLGTQQQKCRFVSKGSPEMPRNCAATEQHSSREAKPGTPPWGARGGGPWARGGGGENTFPDCEKQFPKQQQKRFHHKPNQFHKYMKYQ